jgi:hypothetical protein
LISHIMLSKETGIKKLLQKQVSRPIGLASVYIKQPTETAS